MNWSWLYERYSSPSLRLSFGSPSISERGRFCGKVEASVRRNQGCPLDSRSWNNYDRNPFPGILTGHHGRECRALRQDAEPCLLWRQWYPDRNDAAPQSPDTAFFGPNSRRRLKAFLCLGHGERMIVVGLFREYLCQIEHFQFLIIAFAFFVCRGSPP